MRIQVERDGGFAYFPGLSGPTTVDTDALPPERGGRARGGRRASGLQRRGGARGGACPGSADHRTVTVTVEDEGARGASPSRSRSRTTPCVRWSTGCSRRRSPGDGPRPCREPLPEMNRSSVRGTLDLAQLGVRTSKT